VGVQGFRWDERGTVTAGDYNFFYGKENENQLGTGFLYTAEEYQQLRAYSLLPIGCHI